MDSKTANKLNLVSRCFGNNLESIPTAADVMPHKTMITSFVEHRQNFSELKQMIEETQKKGNKELGQEIIQVAAAVRDKRDQKKGLTTAKDYQHEHTK